MSEPATTPAAPAEPLTDAQALTELERLLVARLMDTLKEPAPKASAMAVAERFLSARKSKMPRPQPVIPLGPMPFPPSRISGAAAASLEPDYASAINGTADAQKMREALTVPFLSDGSPNPDFGH